MLNFLKGILVGMGGIAPGLSGSVLLVILGLYQKTISAIGTLFKDFYRTDKYPISDVTVKNLNTNTELEDLGREEYQVPEGMFYAEPINCRSCFWYRKT